MKKILIILAVLALATPAAAGWNFNFWGSNDHQRDHHKKRVVAPIERPEPGPPVHNVPEPASYILFSTGIVALSAGTYLNRRWNL